MSSFLSSIVLRLSDEGMGIAGQNLFRDFMPETIKRGILVVVGMPISIHPDAPGYRKGGFAVIVRDEDVDRGRELAEQALEALTVQDKAFGSHWFKFIQPRHEPLVFPRSPGGTETSVSFDCAFTIL